ncbi:di-trans,poly-cis-decaprenylcistransferase [Candidatus Roizmanbacteria bacterium RIFCSPLOWO2_01_FULL_37_12]|uniref:Isoprenyl transferase n=1 Tax=Candidatus Roizmanbacteria bacterium RIFCSPLOWO2_01_FULL_37_12 TaxID=1802056 RepID=A0A1F7IEB8_9BACT|nr:MAG: di-trans,poly-cis-decaprenylcistransferase [Candidatus Roizmanbacteria bacterium RIFCSPHIGHO2_02_FULL_37_9b]OGK41696.1 MAG: di-trans,poly-cis-decaprenylcistransferase [Candidatus Roizmanbacteria bacterium RIFCSPLOWO2_01_FULL_37_12]
MNVPTHIAIIPDGNRRWAKKRGLPTYQGHRFAAEKNLPDLLEKAGNLGVKYFTFWALSTENLEKRTKNEVDRLLNLTRFFLKNKIKEFKKKGVRMTMIGNLKKLPKDIQDLITQSLEQTKNNKKMTVVFALNYGGREEIIRAVKRIQNSEFRIQNLNSDKFCNFLDTKGIPDPDLIIRTGGEKRLSGFLPWQSVYSELYFSDLFFPDFSANELEKAVRDYSLRQRRFGK